VHFCPHRLHLHESLSWKHLLLLQCIATDLVLETMHCEPTEDVAVFKNRGPRRVKVKLMNRLLKSNERNVGKMYELKTISLLYFQYLFL